MATSEMNVKIRVVRKNESIVFELSKSIGFDFFVISNADERVFWELKPLSMQPVQMIEVEMNNMRVPPEIERQLQTAVNQITPADEEYENPPVDRIVYGQVPDGYREVVRATPLKTGERYCAFLFGDRFERAGEYFFG